MIASPFKKRSCKSCGGKFSPGSANQQFHARCLRLWRRNYHKRYQRKTRHYLLQSEGLEKS